MVLLNAQRSPVSGNMPGACQLWDSFLVEEKFSEPWSISFLIFQCMGLQLCTLFMTVTTMSSSEYAMVLEWATTGSSSVLWYAMLNWQLLILWWKSFLHSSMYWWLHLLHWINYINNTGWIVSALICISISLSPPCIFNGANCQEMHLDKIHIHESKMYVRTFLKYA